jgi:hypothetical protein
MVPGVASNNQWSLNIHQPLRVTSSIRAMLFSSKSFAT